MTVWRLKCLHEWRFANLINILSPRVSFTAKNQDKLPRENFVKHCTLLIHLRYSCHAQNIATGKFIESWMPMIMFLFCVANDVCIIVTVSFFARKHFSCSPPTPLLSVLRNNPYRKISRYSCYLFSDWVSYVIASVRVGPVVLSLLLCEFSFLSWLNWLWSTRDIVT